MPRKIIPYQSYLKEYARKLRNHSSKSEIILWNRLKKDKILGYDFHRQKPLLKYIVDFYCHELNLAIEIDGITHEWEEVAVNDITRQKEIEKYGVVFLRFSAEDIYKDIDSVLRSIIYWIEEFEKLNGRKALKNHPDI